MARPTPTWVYAMTCGEHTKIGIATDVAARVRGLQGSCPYKVAVFGSRLFESYALARKIETELHEEFAAARGFGEWFRVEPETVMASLAEREEHHRPAPGQPPRAAEPEPFKRHPGWTDSQWRMAQALRF